MPGLDGLEVISQLQTRHPQLPILVHSGRGHGLPHQTIRSGATGQCHP
jgi:FixJ family two-component response regulator